MIIKVRKNVILKITRKITTVKIKNEYSTSEKRKINNTVATMVILPSDQTIVIYRHR